MGGDMKKIFISILSITSVMLLMVPLLFGQSARSINPSPNDICPSVGEDLRRAADNLRSATQRDLDTVWRMKICEDKRWGSPCYIVRDSAYYASKDLTAAFHKVLKKDVNGTQCYLCDRRDLIDMFAMAREVDRRMEMLDKRYWGQRGALMAENAYGYYERELKEGRLRPCGPQFGIQDGWGTIVSTHPCLKKNYDVKYRAVICTNATKGFGGCTNPYDIREGMLCRGNGTYIKKEGNDIVTYHCDKNYENCRKTDRKRIDTIENEGKGVKRIYYNNRYNWIKQWPVKK
jgi:hypothetical protein